MPKVSKKIVKPKRVVKNKFGTIEEETVLLPSLIADTVAEESLFRAYKITNNPVANSEVFITLSPEEKESLNIKTASEIANMSSYLERRAESVFKTDEGFRKQIMASGNKGRDYLYMYMRHWADAKILDIYGRAVYNEYKRIPVMEHGGKLDENRMAFGGWFKKNKANDYKYRVSYLVGNSTTERTDLFKTKAEAEHSYNKHVKTDGHVSLDERIHNTVNDWETLSHSKGISKFENGGTTGKKVSKSSKPIIILESFDWEFFTYGYGEQKSEERLNFIHEDLNLRFETPKGLFEYIGKNIIHGSVQPSNFSVTHDGKLFTSLIVNHDNITPSYEEHGAWKNKEVLLYISEYSFSITLNGKTPTKEELSNLLSINESAHSHGEYDELKDKKVRAKYSNAEGKIGFKSPEGYYVKFADGSDGYFDIEDLIILEEDGGDIGIFDFVMITDPKSPYKWEKGFVASEEGNDFTVKIPTETDGFKSIVVSKKGVKKRKAVEFEHGGSIPNNYEGKTPKQVWDEWDIDQRTHFLVDHRIEIPEFHQGVKVPEFVLKYNKSSYEELPSDIKDSIMFHVNEGQYEKGGRINTVSFNNLQLKPNPNYKYYNNVKKWLEDNPNGTIRNNVVKLLIMEEKSPEDVLQISHATYERILRSIDNLSEDERKIPLQIRHGLVDTSRVTNIYQKQKRVTESLSQMFIINDKNMYEKGGEFKVDKKYTHFAVRKTDNKIVAGWEYKGLDKESIKEYTSMDLKDMDLKPSDFKIQTKEQLIREDINPFDWANWRSVNKEFKTGGSTKKPKYWISGSIEHKGSLRRKAKEMGLIKGDEKLSFADLDKLEALGGVWAKKSNEARNLMNISKKRKKKVVKKA